jgi:hypothetical protein
MELCIQISSYDASQVGRRANGMCWRCVAERTGISGLERENLRPEIDSAFIVEGLEEPNSDERRRRVEVGGHCWFCNAKRDCSSCKTKEVITSLEDDIEMSTPKRGRPEVITTKTKGKRVNKRVKVERRASSMNTVPRLMLSPPSVYHQESPVANSFNDMRTKTSYIQTPRSIPEFDDSLGQAPDYHDHLSPALESWQSDCINKNYLHSSGGSSGITSSNSLTIHNNLNQLFDIDVELGVDKATQGGHDTSEMAIDPELLNLNNQSLDID